MRVIITGSSGFVGVNLVSFLDKKKIEIDKISLRDLSWQNSNKEADAIIHLAGKAHDTSRSSKPKEYFEVNRDLTIQLFNFFIDSEIKDFFYFSSVKAVADVIDSILLEEIEGDPKTPYGKSKLEAEQYLLSRDLPMGKRLFIIRPCMIHGPGNKGNLNFLLNLVKKGIPWPLGSYDNKRSFLGIDNLCFLINSMLENSSIRSGVYNFADDKPLSTNDLVSLISNVLNKNIRILKVNKRFIEVIARIGDKIPLPLNTERLKKLTDSYVVSNQKIKSALGIKELPFTVEEGLTRTVVSFEK